jgi:hypothetical protein
MTTTTTMPTLALPDPTQIEQFILAMDGTLAPLAASIPDGSPLAPLKNIITTVHGVLGPFFQVINQFDILFAQQQQGVPTAAAPGRQFVAQLLGKLISTLHTSSPSGAAAPDVVHQLFGQLLSGQLKPPVAPSA